MRTDFSRVFRIASAIFAAGLCICVAACKASPKQQLRQQQTREQKVEAPLPPPTLRWRARKSGQHLSRRIVG